LRGQFFFVDVPTNTMSAMFRLPARSSFDAAIRAFACAIVAVLATGALAVEPAQRLRLTPEQRREMLQQMTPEQREAWRNARSREERQRAWQGLSPQQRQDMWQQMSPEQRELMMRRMPPEQRQEAWRNMTPEQREAMRQRFVAPRPPDAAPPPRPSHHLTPEERQRLRDQVREAQRDVYRGEHGARGGRGDKGGKR
jgi:hypothetical protein